MWYIYYIEQTVETIMAKQITEIKQTTVELKTSNAARLTLKVTYPNGEGLKIVCAHSGHTITAGNRQIADAALCKILKFVATYATVHESNTQRFTRLAKFFEGTTSIDQAISAF